MKLVEGPRERDRNIKKSSKGGLFPASQVAGLRAPSHNCAVPHNCRWWGSCGVGETFCFVEGCTGEIGCTTHSCISVTGCSNL